MTLGFQLSGIDNDARFPFLFDQDRLFKTDQSIP